MDEEKNKQPPPIVAAEDNGAAADDVAAEKERIHKLEAMLEGAKRATEKEHEMGLLEALRMYPKASAWRILISVAVIMEGFDVVLLNNFCRLVGWLGLLVAEGATDMLSGWKTPTQNSRRALATRSGTANTSSLRNGRRASATGLRAGRFWACFLTV